MATSCQYNVIAMQTSMYDTQIEDHDMREIPSLLDNLICIDRPYLLYFFSGICTLLYTRVSTRLLIASYKLSSTPSWLLFAN